MTNGIGSPPIRASFAPQGAETSGNVGGAGASPHAAGLADLGAVARGAAARIGGAVNGALRGFGEVVQLSGGGQTHAAVAAAVMQTGTARLLAGA